jgi:L-ribulose-5-phosphate 4-epimerase
MSKPSSISKAICELNKDLQKLGLVQWTSGNVSERLPNGKHFIIKPSGVRYEELKPSMMVICDLDGSVVHGKLVPSSDTATHAYIYKHMQWVNGVTHTHSNFASAWAAAGLEIPCGLTAMADEFGGAIPLGPFALIGNEDIGRGVVDTLLTSRSPAVIMANHGVFTVGKNAASSVKSAVMCEDVAKTMYLAKGLGFQRAIEGNFIDQLFERYQREYGQFKGEGNAAKE